MDGPLVVWLRGWHLDKVLGWHPHGFAASAFQGSGVILVNKKAKFCGIGSGLLAVGNKRLVFKLLFSLSFSTFSILSWLLKTFENC